MTEFLWGRIVAKVTLFVWFLLLHVLSDYVGPLSGCESPALLPDTSATEHLALSEQLRFLLFFHRLRLKCSASCDWILVFLTLMAHWLPWVDQGVPRVVWRLVIFFTRLVVVFKSLNPISSPFLIRLWCKSRRVHRLWIWILGGFLPGESALLCGLRLTLEKAGCWRGCLHLEESLVLSAAALLACCRPLHGWVLVPLRFGLRYFVADFL